NRHDRGAVRHGHAPRLPARPARPERGDPDQRRGSGHHGGGRVRIGGALARDARAKDGEGTQVLPAPPSQPQEPRRHDRDPRRDVIARALSNGKPGPHWMDAETMNELFQAYGIRTNRSRPAGNRGEAASVAKSIGFPIVLKVRSPDVVHKTEVGGVRLRLGSEEEVARAFDAVRTALAREKPNARFEGVTVEPMVLGGVETIAGMTRDPSFGPVVLFGLGGIAVELLRDVSLRVAPLTDRDAEEMVREIRGFPLLDGYRGAPRSNVP